MHLLSIMWGFGIYLMRLADYFSGRKYRRQKLRTCDVCSQVFETIEGMEKHRRDTHPNVPPREAAEA